MTQNEDETPEVDADFPSNARKDKIVTSEARSNSIRTREEIIPTRKKVKRVVNGKIFRKKKSFIENLSQTFLGEDSRSVGTYVLWDVLIPAAKNTIQEMVSTGIEMLLFGEARSSSRRRDRERGRSTTSYGSYYHSSARNERPVAREPHYGRSINRRGVEEILFERGDEAADVLAALEDMIEQYDQATVADYYDAAGYPDGNFTDNKWGWEDLSQARCSRVRGGYIIDLPRPIELD